MIRTEFKIGIAIVALDACAPYVEVPRPGVEVADVLSIFTVQGGLVANLVDVHGNRILRLTLIAQAIRDLIVFTLWIIGRQKE